MDLDFHQTEQRCRQARRLAGDQVNPPAPAMPQVLATHLKLHRARLPFARASWQELRLRRMAHFPLLPARARRHSQDRGPSAFFREILVARKYNHAACSGDLPIFVRCRQQRNRRGFAGCDNKCSRSQRKRAGLARPFPIAAADKRQCRPLPFAD